MVSIRQMGRATQSLDPVTADTGGHSRELDPAAVPRLWIPDTEGSVVQWLGGYTEGYRT